MSTNSGRKGSCGRCGHFRNEHAKVKDSKCNKCKKGFEICQAEIHGMSEGGWRICFVPCSCGIEYFPDKARGTMLLQSHEYIPEHTAYRPLFQDDEDEEDNEDNDDGDQDDDDDDQDNEEGGCDNQNSQSQEVNWDPGHNRAGSGASEDQLQWSPARFEQETSIANLAGALSNMRTEEEAAEDWSDWTWSKEKKSWGRSRTNSASEMEYDFQILSGSWSKWRWSEEWQCMERYARCPDDSWGWDYREAKEKEKGETKGKEREPKEIQTSEAFQDSNATQSNPQYNFVDLKMKENRKGHPVYCFYNEDMKEVRTEAKDWSSYIVSWRNKPERLFEYVGKKSGKKYHCWQL